MKDPKNRLSAEQKSRLTDNAGFLARNEYRLITVARFLSAIHESHGIEGISYEAMARLINDNFDVGTTGRNLLNFACRETRNLVSKSEFAACLYLINLYWEELISSFIREIPRQFVELERELQLTNLYAAMVDKDATGFRDHFYTDIELNKIYRAFEMELISLLGIKNDNMEVVKSMLLGDKAERNFVVYRLTSESMNHVLACKVKIRRRKESHFLQFISYGFSETIGNVESVGIVIPMGKVVYFAGFREDHTSLKIYAFPANYTTRIVEWFKGLLLSVDTVGGEPVFSTRVFVEELHDINKVPALLARNEVDLDVLESISNSLPFIIVNNAFDERHEQINTFSRLQGKIEASIDEMESSWKIRNKEGRPLNPLAEHVVLAGGVLTAFSKWAFVKRKEGGEMKMASSDDDNRRIAHNRIRSIMSRDSSDNIEQFVDDDILHLTANEILTKTFLGFELSEMERIEEARRRRNYWWGINE